MQRETKRETYLNAYGKLFTYAKVLLGCDKQRGRFKSMRVFVIAVALPHNFISFPR